VFTFNPDDSVNVEPIIIDFQKRKEIEKRAILFFTGLKREADTSLKKSFFIGNSTRDIQTGNNAKTKTILVETWYAGKDREYDVRADFKVKNLPAAVKVVKRYV